MDFTKKKKIAIAIGLAVGFAVDLAIGYIYQQSYLKYGIYMSIITWPFHSPLAAIAIPSFLAGLSAIFFGGEKKAI